MRTHSALKTQLRWSVLGSLLLTACGGGDSLLLPSEGEPSTIEVVRGDAQSGYVGDPLGGPVVVRVIDRTGRRVEGATVTFELTPAAPNATITPDTATTDANGEASAEIVLGTTIGQQNGQARVVSADGGLPPRASFTAMAVSETANSMAAVGGEDQVGRVGTPLDDRLVVQVTDAFGNPISGVPINWEAEGGGTVSESSVNTDSEGKASVARVLGPATGVQSTAARSEGLAGSPVTFIHSALAGDASILSIVSGDNQTGRVGAQLQAELVVRLVDSEGNGVPNTAVAWVVATGGGSATPATSNTDQDGRAAARWTLGGSPGGNRLDAVVSGVGVASFDAIATTGAPAALSIATQPSASASNGVMLERQPVVQLRDGSGNPVTTAGIPVSAAIGAGSGDLTGTRQRLTDGNGRATFTDLAIVGGGRYTLVFSSSGYASATSSDVNVGAVSTTTTITNDTPDPSIAGSTVTVEFRVSSDGPTPSGSVTVTALNGGATCTGGLSGGAGSCQMTMNLVGDRTLRAEYSGAPGFSPSSDTEGHRVDQPSPENRAPRADYNWHCDGLTCQFTDASSDPDGSISGRSWNFGDGSAPVQDLNPSHTYTSPGDYTVVLTVTDDKGATDESSATVTVEAPPPANQPPTAGFTFSCTDLRCEFEDQSSDADGTITSRNWNFGDGTTVGGNELGVSHTYATPGDYQVVLTVTDNGGLSDESTDTVDPEAPPPQTLRIRDQPSSSATVGEVFDDQPEIELRVGDDDLDRAGVSVSVSANGGGTVNGTTTVTTDNDGRAQFTDLSINGATGSHTLTFSADGFGSVTSENIQVNPPPNQSPRAEDDGAQTPAGTAVTIDVLANDDDPEDAPLTIVNVEDPPNGTAEINDGKITYTPDPGFGGTTDAFSYELSDGSLTDEATVTVTVGPITPPPASGSLGILTQPPSRTESGDRLRPEPEVELRDAMGNSLALGGVTVSAAIASGAGSLGGNTSRATDGNGRARFEELRLNGDEDASVTIAFTAPGFAPVDSQAILIED